ncbi:MAG: sterol desaturase family protein [Flavobacteriales bacterium]|nr:sterol desaturase family protein [Flavobacteriales bacterium]
MTMVGANVKDGGRIFESPVLEALTRTHIAIPLSIFYGTGAVALWFSVARLQLDGAGSLALFLSGVFFFTLVEYLVHRYFYHMSTDSPRKARVQYVFHGVHHDHPRDKKRLALPPLMSVIVASAFISLFRLLMGLHGLAFGGGFLVGYATYLLAHYSIHVYSPPRNFLKGIWKHHNLHHFVGDTGAFGVSSPLWDHVFGTMPEDPRARKAVGN